MNDISLKLKFKIVTPTHIGGASEKNWINGIDYFQPKDSNDIYLIDEDKTINLLGGVENYSNAIATNTLENKLKNINYQNYSKRVIKEIGAVSSEIKRLQKNVMYNKPLLPGSSIKGSIRSIILNFLLNEDLSIKPDYRNNIEKPVFGSIDQDIFRCLVIPDIQFSNSDYWNSKIFNLKGRNFDLNSFSGAWKHDARSSSSKFNEEGFNCIYESFKPGDESTGELLFKNSIFNLSSAHFKKSRGLEKILNTDFKKNILQCIKKYTHTFILKEIEWFKKYSIRGDSDIILKHLYNLIKEAEDNVLIRCGQGSGFHSMTGDWRFNSHIMNHFHEQSRDAGKLLYKSRKIAFQFDEDLNDYRFETMGYIKLIPI